MTALTDIIPTRPGQLPNNLPTTSTDHDYVQFLRAADGAVEEHEPRVRQLLAESNLGPGFWHPNGFATFEIASIPDLGLLRLHTWPKGMRRSLSGHPEIHNHSFQLFSRIIAGVYRETQYRVDDAGTALHRYEVDVTGIRTLDSIADTGLTTRVIKTVSGVAFEAGSWHEVEVGQFHATPIPRSGFCVTLAVISPRIPGSTDVLLGRPGFAHLAHQRPPVNDGEMVEIYSQLESALS